MDTRSRPRLAAAVVLSLLAVGLVVLALSSVYGLAAEYGGGSFVDLAFLVVPIPVLGVAAAVGTWPGLRSATRVAAVLGSAALMVGGGLAADELGQRAGAARMVAESNDFTCDGPHAEITLPPEIDETWAELPRRQPIYGPIAGSRTDCVAAVSGDGEESFAAYTAAFRELDGWEVEVDRPRHFTMSRQDVQVTVTLTDDGLTTIRVGVVS